MKTVNVEKILKELYNLAHKSDDEQVKLKAYSMILDEKKSERYQNVVHETIKKMVNTYTVV